jgi:hypothetical protein
LADSFGVGGAKGHFDCFTGLRVLRLMRRTEHRREQIVGEYRITRGQGVTLCLGDRAGLALLWIRDSIEDPWRSEGGPGHE